MKHLLTMFLTSPGMSAATKLFSFSTYNFNSSKVSCWIKCLRSSNAVSTSEQMTIQPQYSPSSLFPYLWFMHLKSFFYLPTFLLSFTKESQTQRKARGFFVCFLVFFAFLLVLFTPEDIPVFGRGELRTRCKL